MNSDKRIWKENFAIAFDGLVRKEIWLSFVIAIMCLAVMGVPVSADVSVTLTSITLDPEDSTGTTTNAPGAWSTNTADPLSQVGVMSSGGVFLNQGAESGTLGEIAIPLEPGINTFTLYGNHVCPGNAFYGAVLFFDEVPTPPQVAVYNSNYGLGDFLVQPVGTTIMGGANGGLFFDVAPGTSVYIASDGTKVEVVRFVINSMSSSVDEISFGGIGSDGTFDTTAELILKVTPIPAIIDINPDTLNTKSNVKWITAYIELPEGYDVNDIDVSTIYLEDTFFVDTSAPATVGDYDIDGISDLRVKFDRAAVVAYLGTDYYEELTITGELTDETSFEGSDTIRVIDK